jgi:hypothetical protein
MRYRIILDQVMEQFYVTVITWEPDGLHLEKRTTHYQFEVSPEQMTNLPIILRRLSLKMDADQF